MAVLTHAGLLPLLAGVVSADEVQTYKPAPSVYRHLAVRMGTEMKDTWLVSSNPFDVIGAISAGMKAAWVKRSSDSIFDPWGIEPTITVSSLSSLTEQIAEKENR